MATKKLKGYLALELLAVILLVVLIVVLTTPPKIWKMEEKKKNDCQMHMKSIYVAETYFYKNVGVYTSSFDTLLMFVKSDTVLKRKRQIVEFSRELFEHLRKGEEIPFLNAIERIHSAIYTITGDFQQNESYFETQDSSIFLLKEPFEQVVGNLNNFYDPVQYKNVAKILEFLSKRDSLIANINDFRLQNASSEAKSYMDSLLHYYQQADFDVFVSRARELQNNLYSLINAMNKTRLRTLTNLPDRLKKFTDQFRRATEEIPLLVKDEQVGLMNNYVEQLHKIHQKFIDPANFLLSKEFTTLALVEEDSLLIKLAPEFAFCPDNGEPYLLTFYGNNKSRILIECPNLFHEYKDLVQSTVTPLKGLKVLQAWKYLDEGNTKLLDALEQGMGLYRKTKVARDLIFIKKEAETKINLFYTNTPLSYKYSRKVQEMVDTLANEFHLSVLKTLLEENLSGMETLAKRCEDGNFEAIDKWVQNVTKSVLAVDSAFKANTKLLSRADRSKLMDLKPVVEEWNAQLQEFKKSFTPDQAPVLLESRNKLESVWEEHIQKGKKISTKGIFRETHKNHGYVDNGIYSWELK